MKWTKSLTQKQYDVFLLEFLPGRKTYKEKVNHVIKQIKPRIIAWGLGEVPTNVKELEDFYFYLKSQKAHLTKKYYEKNKAGNALFKFMPIENPEVGMKCHVSFLHKGAQFIIIKLEGPDAYLDNPKYPRKSLLKVPKSTLVHTRKTQHIIEKNQRNVPLAK